MSEPTEKSKNVDRDRRRSSVREKEAWVEAGSSAGGQEAVQPEAPSLDLGVLNRHWYRRCLDALDRRLRESSANPSIEDLKKLCDHIVTGFLTAITGQAPDSNQLQFPADRAYFIPFEGDLAKSFNFSKPFYRFSGRATEAQKEWRYENSIWAFYPWAEKIGDVKIDNRRSVDADDKTISFEEMISVRAQFTRDDKGKERTDGKGGFLLEKSLVLRGDDRFYLEKIFGASDPAARQEILAGCATTMLGIFEVYGMTPGNAAVESILLRHVTIIRWLMTMLSQEEKGAASVAVQDEDFRALFVAFLRYFFLGTSFGERVADDDEEQIEALSKLLVESRGMGAPGDSHPEERGDGQVIIRSLEKQGTPFARWLASRKDGKGGEAREALFQEVETDLKSFRQYFLRIGSEERIEGDLVAALGAKLPKTGEIRQSFVWVIPDFEAIDDSLPEGFTVQERTRKQVHELSSTITGAYRVFCERFDAICLEVGGRREKLDAYWRTLGQANRRESVFSSFRNDGIGLYVPRMTLAEGTEGDLRRRNEEVDADDERNASFVPASPVAREGGRRKERVQSRPQNFFLRVKICDSLNEPVINGLFVISTDHDEVIFKGKSRKVREEDREDLLAFSKVYFFVVREYLRALDQAQTARDIGQLNQYLYDKRLGDLEQRMQRRIEDRALLQGGIAEERNWSLFSYEIVNNYGFSLIKKPDDVQSETFPYDRLLILPLGAERREGEYSLPFYLFQSIFAERLAGEIQKGHYSLIKPFQSPIEEIEVGEASERFRAKSFQQVSLMGDKEVRLDRYLEKLYVGAQENLPDGESRGRRAKEQDRPQVGTARMTGEPESFVVKLIRAAPEQEARVSDAGAEGAADREGGPQDRGGGWVAEAIDSFWIRWAPAVHLGLWRGFLNRLTESFAKLRHEARANREPAEEHWFLLRFGLLRVLLARQTEQRDSLLVEAIRRAYRGDLKLRFDNDTSLDVIKLATRWSDDPFADLAESLPLLTERPAMEIQFESFALSGQDPFMLEFFRHLTNLVRNNYGEDQGWTSTAQATWYQPLLTRPFEASQEDRTEVGESGRDLTLHRIAGEKIKNRVPPYEQIEAGQHALSMFLGLINFSVGQGKQKLRLRCLVAMIRDYDDTKTGAGLTAKEIEQQLNVDLRDLGLYTTTFFRNVRKFAADTMAREENRVLSTDISQIARNWYSTGMDSIASSLRRRLDRMLDDRTDLRLGTLRPELMDEFFDSILKVMLRQEERPSAEGEPILLESFPFDRLLHVPLALGSSEGARLCYARTRIEDVAESGQFWSVMDARRCYEEIRRSGRIWLQRNGRKVWAGAVHHFAPSLQKRGESAPEERLISDEKLRELLKRISQPRSLDAFVRSLYEANAIQTLAVSGLILHLLKIRPDSLPAQRYQEMRGRLESVVEDSIRSVEQAGASVVSGIYSAVYMDRKAVLRELSDERYMGKEAEFSKDLRDINCLPVWFEFFRAAEGTDDCIYGLHDRQGKSIHSKLFYVYYSIEAPRTFTEVSTLGARFRGIFALVVDDSSTDVKNEIGEVADQQDIRTFIHNAVRSLGTTLESQSLENKIRQPGIESFVLGMLHRLKNELGKPAAVLYSLKERARSKKEIDQIEGATSTIAGLKELFEGLRGLSEIQRGVVPIRSFSTNWLGWLLVAKLALAARKVADELNHESGRIAADLQELERIRKRAETELRCEPREPLRAIDLIQRVLKELEVVMRELAAHRMGGANKQDILLSFQVFADEPLEFLGSFQLEEALNILFENAFQAFWEHILQTADALAVEPHLGVLKVVCRRSDEIDGEILIEISNSSQVIDRSILRVLNDRVAQPMTRQQHSSKSRKKGGSGFGHYYARRIVADLCGGREVRRDLDVRIDYLRDTGLAKVRVNLIAASSEGVQPILAEQIQAEVWRNFETRIDLDPKTASGYYVPQNIDVKSLFDLIRRILLADRETIEKGLMSLWQWGVCGTLSVRCEKVRQTLVDRLEALELADAPNGGRWRELRGRMELDGVGQVRQSSFHDLRMFLHSLRDRKDGVLAQIAQGNGLLETTLADVRAGGDLAAEALIEPDERRKITARFEQYSPHLRKGIAAAEAAGSLFENLDQDERGMPVPAKERLADLLEPMQWWVEARPSNGSLHLAISLVDGNPRDVVVDLDLDRPASQELALYNRYQFVGPTFYSYSRSFEQTKIADAPIGQLWLEVPKQGKSRQVPRRTVHLVLKKQEIDGGGATGRREEIR